MSPALSLTSFRQEALDPCSEHLPCRTIRKRSSRVSIRMEFVHQLNQDRTWPLRHNWKDNSQAHTELPYIHICLACCSMNHLGKAAPHHTEWDHLLVSANEAYGGQRDDSYEMIANALAL
jgi:hypothetical protein